MVFDNSAENDGVFHAASDPGINGVTVTLTGTDDQGNTVNLTQVTSTLNGQAGSYVFSGLRPSNGSGYTITETGIGVPATFLDGKDSVPGSLGGNQANPYADQVTAIPVMAGANGVNYNFGEIEPATLSGVVFDNSAENDGVFHAATDPGINGVTVTLTGTDDQGNAVNLSTTTVTLGGQAGSYVFGGLRPSNRAGYTITETGAGVPAAFLDGKDSVPGSLGGRQANAYADQVTAIPVMGGANGVNYNFGEIKGATLSGMVFADYNNDGTENGPDQGIAGVTVTLTGTDANDRLVNQTTTTAADGTYSFTGLQPGTYTITETQPRGYFDGKDILGSAGGTNTVKNQFATIRLRPGQLGSAYNFAEVPMADPRGTVYVDLNHNGILDPGEPGIPGVTVTLTGGDVFGQTIARTVLTDGNGMYQFTGLAPGVYSITEKPPVGYVHGSEQNGSPPATTILPYQFIGIDLTSAPFFGSGYNFGELRPLGGSRETPSGAPTDPVVYPTFISKALLLGSDGNGGLTENVLFVNMLYHELLGRSPNVSEVNLWVFQLDGGVSPTQVAEGIWLSAILANLYQDVLTWTGGATRLAND